MEIGGVSSGREPLVSSNPTILLRVKSSANILSDDEFQFNEQLFLLGYSEGGYATLAAQRGIELNFNDEIPKAS